MVSPGAGYNTVRSDEVDPQAKSDGRSLRSPFRFSSRSRLKVCIPIAALVSLIVLGILLSPIPVLDTSRRFLSPYYSGSSNLRNWGSCAPCNPSDKLCSKWGSQVILRSRAYEGSGNQFQPFVKKARTPGEVLNIGILGGSISFCADSKREDCFVTKLGEQLVDEFALYGTQVKISNGAVRAAGSDFFSACWESQFSEKMDVIILEFAVNDFFAQKTNEPMDILVRAILGSENPPALLFFNMHSPAQPSGYPWSWSNASPSIESIAQYYDIPVISHRNVVYHQRQLHRKYDDVSKWFSQGEDDGWKGGHHPSVLGHELSADIITSFFVEQLCKGSFQPELLASPGAMDLDLPASPSPWGPYQSFNEAPAPVGSSKICYGSQPGRLHFPLSSDPAETHGFSIGHWKGKQFLVGYNPGDRATFNIILGDGGLVSVMYWQGEGIGLGRARIWLEGEEAQGAHIYGDYSGGPNQGNRVTKFDLKTSLPPGPHKLFIEIIEATGDAAHKHEVRISVIVI